MWGRRSAHRRGVYVMYSGLSLRPDQCRGDAGVHGTATSSAAMLSFRWKMYLGLLAVFLGLLGGDSAKVTFLRGLLGGGGGGGATKGGGGGVGSEAAGESLGLSW